MRYHYTTIKTPKIKRTDNSAGKDVEQLQISFTASENTC